MSEGFGEGEKSWLCWNAWLFACNRKWSSLHTAQEPGRPYSIAQFSIGARFFLILLDALQLVGEVLLFVFLSHWSGAARGGDSSSSSNRSSSSSSSSITEWHSFAGWHGTDLRISQEELSIVTPHWDYLSSGMCMKNSYASAASTKAKPWVYFATEGCKQEW